MRDALGELQPEGAKEAHGKLQAVIQAQKGVRDALGELQLEGAKKCTQRATGGQRAHRGCVAH